MRLNTECKGKFKIERRSPIYHTHSNVIDDSIDSIQTYAIRPNKFLILLIFYFLTFGILYLLRLIFPSILIFFACSEEIPEQSNYVKVYDRNGKSYVLLLNNVNLYESNILFRNKKITSISKTELKNKHYVGIEKDNEEEFSKVFTFKYNRYIYSEKDKVFYPIVFELNDLTNDQVHTYFGKGSMNFNDYHFQLNKFGLNTVITHSKGICHFIIHNSLTLPNIYNYFSIVILIINDYWIYPIFLFILTFVVIVFHVFFSMKNDSKIFKIKPTTEIEAKRDFQPEVLDFSHQNNNEIIKGNKIKEHFVQQNLEPEDINDLSSSSNFYSSKFLVPGDLISIRDDMIMPCDGIILDGSCTVDEGDLNGENKTKIKFEIPYDSSPFTFVSNKKSILFQGTKISQCQSSDKKFSKINVLVINTGMSTYRSSLIQNYNENKIGNFNFYYDLFVIIIALFFFWIASVIYNGIFTSINYASVKYSLFLLTILISPSLSICVNLCCIFFHFKLQKRGISCRSNDKLLTSGRVDTVILDKTGTLIEEELELLGFQTVNETNEFDKIYTNEKYFKSLFINFWKEQINKNYDKNTNLIINTEYQNSTKNYPIYFTECLACCNYVNTVKNEKISGNYIDMLIFNCFNWELQTIKSQNRNEQNQNFIYPKNSYKIIDESIQYIDNPYKLQYIKRYQFSPQTQTQSVVVRNVIDNSYRLYIKGSTDKIKEFCEETSIPENYDELVRFHTQEGYRLISCATKVLEEDDIKYIEETNDVFHFKEDMTFLGFAIFKNAPKRDTKRIITALKDVGIKIILATDENPYSAQSIAEDCGITQKEEGQIFLIDYNQDEITKFWKFQIDLKKEQEEEEFRSSLEDKKINEFHQDSSAIFKRHFGNKMLNPDIINVFSIKKTNTFIEKESCKHPEINSDDLEKITSEKKAILSLNGSALIKIAQYEREKEQLEEKGEKDKLTLLKLVKEKARIFYRLNHNDKTILINFLESNTNSVIAMCGEASIDSNSLIASDLSISLKQIEKNTNIISNFSSSANSISCIKTILKTGRACYESSIILIKYIVLIGIIRLLMQLKFIHQKELITAKQTYYLDIFCVLIPVFLSSITGANYNLSTHFPPTSLINKNFLISILGQFLIQFGSQLLFITYIANIYHFNDDETRFQSVSYIYI